MLKLDRKKNPTLTFIWNVLMAASTDDCVRKNLEVLFIALWRLSWMNKLVRKSYFYFEIVTHDNYSFNLQVYVKA